jgi:D-glucuronyl C5-epimerase-like protein
MRICLFNILLLLILVTSKNYGYKLHFDLFNYAVNIEHWEDNKTFTFDSDGVILADGNYNVVSISQYAIKCYDMFITTKDSLFLQKYLNQFQYVSDHEEYIGEDKIAFSYNFQFHNLSPGWYSGLAQSEVAMLYFRHYILFQSDSTVRKIKFIMNFMIQDLSDYDLSYGEVVERFWVQEYVGCDIYDNVLNGNLIALICMKEVMQLFDDDYLNNLFLSGIKTLETDIGNYINPDSLSLFYDTRSKSVCTGWYIKAVYWEMKTLARLTDSKVIYNYSLLLAYLSYNNNFNFIGCNFNTKEFIFPCDFTPNLLSFCFDYVASEYIYFKNSDDFIVYDLNTLKFR